MAAPLQRVCARARQSHRQLSSPFHTTIQTRTYHVTQCRQRQKAGNESGAASKSRENTRTHKRTPLQLSQIDAPRSTSSKQLLDVFEVEEDDIDKIINEKPDNEYLEFLNQYGAAVSLERPTGYDDFMNRSGIDRRSRPMRKVTEGAIYSRMRDTSKLIQATERHFRSILPESDPPPKPREGFVSDGDKGEEFSGYDETYEADDITATAHGYLEQHREIREYYRLAAWELPLLTQYAKAFEPPSNEAPLRFRYTSYMGEQHPSEKKVVLEFCTADLPLSPKQRQKFVKLLGQRYNPQKDLVKMSCESFPDPLQNKRYLSDLVDNLLAEARLDSTAKDGKDLFDDIPADFRHVKWKKEPKFPDSWKMTPERREMLFRGWAAEVGRSQQALIEDSTVSGLKTLDKSFGAPPAVAAPQEVLVRR